MARKNKSGQYIISAAEVGTYTVCAESWRLRSIEKLDQSDNLNSVEIGNTLHNKWAQQNAEAIYFQRAINILCLLLANALVLAIYIMDNK